MTRYRGGYREEAMTCIDVTHEACWVIDEDGAICIYHGRLEALVCNGYRVSGVEGQPWRFKVEMEVAHDTRTQG